MLISRIIQVHHCLTILELLFFAVSLRNTIRRWHNGESLFSQVLFSYDFMLMSKEIWGLLVSWCFVCFIISPWQFSLEEGGGCFSLNACIVSDANGKRGESRKLKPTSIRERPSTITHFQPDFQFIICYSAKHGQPYVFLFWFYRRTRDKIHRPQA